SHKALAEKCGKDQPTLTRIVDLLIKKKYVIRIPHPVDRRSQNLQLTELGTSQVETLAPIVKNFRMKAWDNLTDEDFENFTRILNTIHNNLESDSI
ncbi:MAG: MarR family winged helix-turn-helix transcriptional regulator, partial [Sphingobacterium sp.]